MICLLRYGGGYRFDTASSHTCTVHCTRAGILCTSGVKDIIVSFVGSVIAYRLILFLYIQLSTFSFMFIS
jgi:hypothetical protein